MATIENEDPAQTAFSIQMAQAQTASAFEIRDSDGGVKFKVNADGTGTFPDAIQPFIYTTFYSSLQHAVDALPSDANTGGGTIYHPAGIMYEMGGTIIPSHVTILGAGRKSSCISWENYTDVPQCPECVAAERAADLPLLAFRCTDNEQYAGGGAVIESGLRDLYLHGKVGWAHEDQYCIGTHWLKTPGQAEDTNIKGGWRVWLEGLSIRHFGRAIMFYPAGIYGLMGFVMMRHLRICNTYGEGVMMVGDNRMNSYEDVHVSNVWGPFFGCMQLWGHYSLAMESCCTEVTSSGPGLTIISARGGTIKSHYCESIIQGIQLMETTTGVDVSGCFFYGGDPPFVVSRSTGNSIHDCTIQYGGDHLCEWKYDISGNKFWNVGASGAVNRHHDFGIGEEWEAYGKPAYIEDCTSESATAGQIISGRLDFGVNPLSDGFGNAQLVLRVKTTAGAPTDAEFGSKAGTIVFNSNESKLYVKASATTDDWHQVGLT